ncbi:hypothetical protein FPRO05_12612 [Fusarium proliferatum]|uniref:Nephrocystin 3-like N-terminal domain-containing protein n=1 Tax=Gibberella intermedia TaxID=948311 RepID=A0A365N4M0_GIBIN|nr:hypothetical protein FPRO05_12612 [Fusarium proliferatum]
MSDLGSDSGSSSDDSVRSRPSLQRQDENEDTLLKGTKNAEDEKKEGDENFGKEVLESNPIKESTFETKDEALQLIWQDLVQESDAGNQATEARLIDFVVIPGVYGSWTNKDFGSSPGSGSSAWVTKFAEEGWEKSNNAQSSCRVFRFEYNSAELFSGHRSREAIDRIAFRLLNGLRSMRSDETKKRQIYFISHDIGGTIVKHALVTASLLRASWQDVSEMTRVLVFDDYCSTLGIPFEKRLLAPAGMDYSHLTHYLAKIESDFREPEESIRPRQYAQERKLLALASPIYPFRNKIELTPLADLPDYQVWLKSPCPRILYLHGSHHVRDMAESVFYDLENEATKMKRRASALYFSFDRFDVRADSIRDMIATFLAQICSHNPRLGSTINRLCSQIDNEKGWTETDLIQFFEMFRISAEVEQTMIVINHFDECTKGSRKRFLDHIIDKYHKNETPWKIVVTSHEPGALTEELSGPFCVPIDISSEELGDLAMDSFESEIGALIRSRGDLSFSEDQVLTELRFTEELKTPLRHIFFEQLRVRDEWPDEISSNEIFGSLNLSTQEDDKDKTMESVLHAVLMKCPDQESIECLLSWLLYAVRPLTIWELATVISFSDQRECSKVSPSFMAVNRLVERIEKDFAGILEVDHNEVRFKHPCLHEVMVNGDPSSQNEEEKGYLWNKIKGNAHNLIQSMCLDYLFRDSVQEYVTETFSVADSAGFETTHFPDRTNLASYAIQAWSHHYSLTAPVPDISALSLKRDRVQTLAKAYWCLSNPATRRSPCFQSLFPIFASLGLPNIVEPLGSDDALRGLIEAASKGQKQVVEDLLGEYDFTPTEIWDVLKAAGSSGHEEMMNGLLDKIEAKGEIPKQFEWPPVLIYRAANLGLEGFTQRLLSLGCPPDSDVDWGNDTFKQVPPLYQAASHGYTKTVRVLLKYGANMELKGPFGRNPLHKAALEGHTETVKAILGESQVNIDCTTESKLTPLYLAVLFGSHDTVKLLLEKGADPNMGISASHTDDDRWTPLHAATDDSFIKCIRLLLDNGADPNIPGPSGPPLYRAVANGRTDILDMLLDAGANPQSEVIKKPLLITSVGSDLKGAGLRMLERLLELKLDVNCKDGMGNTLLATLISWYASETADDFLQRDKALRMLLDHGADANLAGDDMWTPLQHTVLLEQYNAVETLLEAGADPNIAFKGMRPPLGYALKQPKIVRLLLEKGADPDARFSKGFTPLIYAACHGYQEAVEKLLEHGATVDLEYGLGVDEPRNDWFKGWTPLMIAAYRGHGGIVRMLAEAGADMHRREKETGRPIIHLAIAGGTLSTVLEFPSRINLNAMASNGLGVLHYADVPLPDLKLLVNAGANIDIDIGPGSGYTPLHAHACRDFEKVQCIVKRGANVNSLCPRHGSPLHQACRFSRSDIIKFLIEHGANVNITDDYLGTPMQALFLAHSPIDALEQEKIVRYLLSGHESKQADVTTKAGLLGYSINSAALGSLPPVINLILDQRHATVNVTDDMGRMPIHLAACNGLANFEAILERGGDIHAKDKQGRTPLHWAAQTGRLQVVKKIISLIGDKLDIDVLDIDGWTPLCWAPRYGLTVLKSENAGESAMSTDVVRLLIEHGAKTDVTVKQGEETWTPLSIAYYHRSDPDVISLLDSAVSTNRNINQDSDKEIEMEVKATTKRGVQQENTCCDYCLSRIYGLYWGCETCKWFCLCDKCYQHADILHPAHGDFTQKGEEECEEGEQDVSATTTSGSSDTYSNSDSDSDSGSNHSEAGEDNQDNS